MANDGWVALFLKAQHQINASHYLGKKKKRSFRRGVAGIPISDTPNRRLTFLRVMDVAKYHDEHRNGDGANMYVRPYDDMHIRQSFIIV
eukprot:scaffold86507_cov26-Prasinocladus_malaysianus.AAC.1